MTTKKRAIGRPVDGLVRPDYRRKMKCATCGRVARPVCWHEIHGETVTVKAYCRDECVPSWPNTRIADTGGANAIKANAEAHVPTGAERKEVT